MSFEYTDADGDTFRLKIPHPSLRRGGPVITVSCEQGDMETWDGVHLTKAAAQDLATELLKFALGHEPCITVSLDMDSDPKPPAPCAGPGQVVVETTVFGQKLQSVADLDIYTEAEAPTGERFQWDGDAWEMV